MAEEQRGTIIWQFDEDVAEPEMILRVARAGDAPPVIAQPVPPPTEENFRRDFELLQQTARSFKDTVNEKLTWLVENEGRFIAMANAETLDIRRFERMFGFDRVKVNNIVFSENSVWVGSDRGLFVWDRKLQYWGRFAVGGVLVETFVRELSIRDGIILEVTTGREDERPRRFEFEIEPGRWREL